MLTADAQYAANIATMSQQPSLASLIDQLAQMPLINLQMGPGPAGHLVGAAYDMVTQTAVPLCDLGDPVAGAEAAVEQMWSPGQVVYTMIGLGLGYAIQALAKKLLPYQRLVVWEPEPMFFKAMLSCLDVQTIFSGTRVEVFVGSEVFPKIEQWYMSLEVHEKLHLGFPVSHAYTSVYRKADYEAVLARCMDMLRFHMVGLATWKQFGHCIGDNDILNMPEFYASPGMAALQGLWAGRPAVCVAAGPSLQKNLAHLLPADARSKVALITVGTMYALLQAMGLAPDIVTTIDFQALNWTDQFQYVPLDPDCSLVYLHSTYPQTVRRWPGPRFVATNSSDTMNWIQQYAEEQKGGAGQVQTVAHLNLLVALALGANPIILVGQDLSMPMEAHHAMGARAQDLSPMDVQQEAFLDVTDMHGQPIKTRHSFQSMLLVFERIIAEHPEVAFVNASEQGLAIKGAVQMPLAQALVACPTIPSVGREHDRPVFQGETPAHLLSRQSSSLRRALKNVHLQYVPQVKAEFPEAFAQLCQQVDDIGTWARDLTQGWNDAHGHFLSEAQRAAAASSDVLSDADTLEWLALEYYQEVVASEKVLIERQHATSMYVIRRFDFIELRGAIPPAVGVLTEPWHHARYAAERLHQAALMFVEEWPVLQKLLRQTRLRLAPAPHVTRAIARQQYPHALRLLQALPPTPGTPLSAHLRVLAQLLRHTQQYDAALALMGAWGDFPTMTTGGTARHAERIRNYLARYLADARHAFPAYFGQAAAPVPAESLGDTTHAWAIPVSGLDEEDVGYTPVMLSAPLSLSVNGHAAVHLVQDAAGYPLHDYY